MGTGKCVCTRPVQECYTSRSTPTPGPSVPWTWPRMWARSVSSTPTHPGSRFGDVERNPTGLSLPLGEALQPGPVGQHLLTPTHPPYLFLIAPFCSRGHLCTHLEAEQKHREWLHRGGCGERGAGASMGQQALSSPLLPQVEHCHGECVPDTQLCGAQFCDPLGSSFAVTGYDLTEILRFSSE